jgi:hypothetical protein
VCAEFWAELIYRMDVLRDGYPPVNLRAEAATEWEAAKARFAQLLLETE